MRKIRRPTSFLSLLMHDFNGKSTQNFKIFILSLTNNSRKGKGALSQYFLYTSNIRFSLSAARF
jgi:hypothetical protein